MGMMLNSLRINESFYVKVYITHDQKEKTILDKLLKEKIALYEAITTGYDHKRIDNLINIYENNQK